MALNQRRILLTGATNGLGLALTHEFVARGQQVYGCGRSVSAVAELKAKYPEQHFSVVDVTQSLEVEGWAASVRLRCDCPDLLINCAGIANQPKPLWKISPSELDEVLSVNVAGVFNVLRAFLPAMIDSGNGVIVNFSSDWGREGAAGFSPYCASKFAVEGLTQSLAQELPRGLAAVALDPGTVNTNMLQISIGSRAEVFPQPAAWAKKAAPFVLALSAADNGKSLTVEQIW